LKNSKLPICVLLKIDNKNVLKYIGESGNDLLECLNRQYSHRRFGGMYIQLC
jgi:hypothetical protein